MDVQRKAALDTTLTNKIVKLREEFSKTVVAIDKSFNEEEQLNLVLNLVTYNNTLEKYVSARKIVQSL